MILLLIAVAVESVLLVALGILILGAFHEVGRLDQTLSRFIVADGAPVSRLVAGDQLPGELGFVLPPRAFLVLVSYGCGGCSQLCSKLQRTELGSWEMVVILKGHPIDVRSIVDGHGVPEGMDDSGGFPIPPYAQLVRDPEGRLLRVLGVTKTPTAMAVVGGRLTQQILAPTVDWFTELQRTRVATARKVLNEGVGV